MINYLKDKFRRPYLLLKYYLFGSSVDFDKDTIPLVDKDVPLSEVLTNIDIPADIPYDLKEKLEFWRENGYVVLENVLPVSWLDKLWEEVEDTIDNHQKYEMKALVDNFNNQKLTALKDVPKEKLNGIGSRITEYHNVSIGAKKVMTHQNIVTFLKAVLSNELTAFQSLIFKYSSQQGTHQDFPWVTSKIPSHLAAAWIPLEDVDADSGPLFYYPGSHKMPKFNFGNTGFLYEKGKSLFGPQNLENYLNKTAESIGLKRKVLLIKKGDILIWHGALAHGGSQIGNRALTRKSYVCHYSTIEGYPKHRYETNDKSDVSFYNGVGIYPDPQNLGEDNILKSGENWM